MHLTFHVFIHTFCLLAILGSYTLFNGNIPFFTILRSKLVKRTLVSVGFLKLIYSLSSIKIKFNPLVRNRMCINRLGTTV